MGLRVIIVTCISLLLLGLLFVLQRVAQSKQEAAGAGTVEQAKKMVASKEGDSGMILTPLPEDIALPHGWLMIKVGMDQELNIVDLDRILRTNNWSTKTSQGIVIMRQFTAADASVELVQSPHQPYWPNQ